MIRTSAILKPPNTDNEQLAVPGTSYQHNDENPTRTKALNKISPLPVLKKKKTARSIIANTPKVLNSSNNIERLKMAEGEKRKD